jgi:2-methylcitrate dehydratase PrpD
MTVHGLDPSDIESVDLLVPPFALRIASFHEPANGEQSKFSLEQAVAGILVHGVPRLPYVHAFTDEAAVDPRYVEARGRVRVVVDESRPNVRGFDEQTVTLRLRDGRQLSLAVDRLDVAGRTGNPLTVEARLDVFRATAQRLGGDRTERLIDVVMGFENHTVPDVAALVGAPTDR